MVPLGLLGVHRLDIAAGRVPSLDVPREEQGSIVGGQDHGDDPGLAFQLQLDHLVHPRLLLAILPRWPNCLW